MTVHPPTPSRALAPSWTRDLPRDLMVLIAGLGLGLVVGLRLERAPAAPERPPAERIAVAPTPPPPPAREAADEAPADVRRRADLAAAVEVNEGELRALARALADPAAYRHVRAVLADVDAFEEALRRRQELHARLGEPAAPGPSLPPGLQERARRLRTERGAVLTVEVEGAPDEVEVLPCPPAEGATTLGPPRPGVALGNDGPLRTVTFRTRADGLERTVHVVEDPQGGRDRLRVMIGPVGGPPTFARSTRVLGGPGRAWQDLIAHLWERGSVPFHALEALASGGEAALPSRRGGWIDWVRRHVDLPPNPELNEPQGAPPPLPADNPLLLVGDAQPVLLERPDLSLDPEQEQPPLLSPARGPMVLVAANGLGVFDGGWRWLVFDPARGRAVEHLPGAGPGGAHLRWEFYPDPERTRLGRGPALVRALCQLAQERTRQALGLLLLRREVTALEREMDARIGGLYTADGLAALRLHEALIDRHKRLQALSHLLLDADAAAQSDRAVAEGARRGVARLVALLEAMIDAGRQGPVEYLLRDDQVKAVLFQAPHAYRLRLCQAYRQRFGRWRGLPMAFGGEPPRWYEVE
ncbi:MAG: hypothetical protein M9894_27090 [Planctomycetes bacterium]|nr:hypothetical protein [Planctomycetota bacterium]